MNEEKPIENVSPPIETQTNAAQISSILSRLESKKEDAAVNLGISASEVETLPFDLSALETEGIFLNIDCRRLQHSRTPNRMEIARRRIARRRRGAPFSAACRAASRRLPPKADARGEPGAQRA